MCTRPTLVGHLGVGVDSLDLRALDDTTSSHLLTHEDDELKGGIAGLLVDLLGAEDSLGREVRDEVELIRRNARHELGEEENAVLKKQSGRVSVR